MRTTAVYVMCLLMALVLNGCIPERVVWSPDGTRALVLADDGLHIGDADGKLGPVIQKDVARTAWLLDGKGILVVTKATYKTWTEFAKASGASVNKEAVAKLRRALSGEQDATKGMTENEKILAGLYLRESEPGFTPLAGTETDLISDKREYTPTVCQLYDLDAGQAKAGPVLFWGSENHTLELRVSKSGKYAAITMMKYDDKAPPPQLFVVATRSTTKEPRVLELGDAGSFPDWDVDDKAIVYHKPVSDKDVLASITRQTVLDEKGTLLTKDQLPERQDLANLVFDVMGRVRCAADGRIYFSAMEVTLPSGPRDGATKASLFMIQPGKQATVTRVLPRSVEASQENSLLQFFELSPDGRMVTLPSENGRVAVMELATGDVQQVQPDLIDGTGGNLKLSTVPTWRSANELTFVRPAKGGPEVVRYSVTDPQHPVVVLSTGWEAAAKDEWLKKVQPEK